MTAEDTEQSNSTVTLSVDIAAADAAYKPFPPFEKWRSLRFAVSRLDQYQDFLGHREDIDRSTLSKSIEIVKKTAAIETGAIERLYEADRGFTFTMATQAGALELALAGEDHRRSAMIEAQYKAYDAVIDFATRAQPIGEAWIRDLHRQICQAQKTYHVRTPIGDQDQELPLGEYKSHPNHVRTISGEIHSYAPVAMTPPEMTRLCGELAGETFLGAHPVLQAAYAHYALAAIHPFADGNGRVARALGSVFTARAYSVPLLILADQREEYFRCLEAADNGDYQTFLDFICERNLDALQLARESIRAAKAPPASRLFEDLRGLFRTRGGYTHASIDHAADQLANLIADEFQRVAQERNDPETFTLTVGRAGVSPPQSHAEDSDFRSPLSGVANTIQISLHSSPPASAQVTRQLTILVPRDAEGTDSIRIRDLSSGELFEARINELTPKLKNEVWMRARMWAESIIGVCMDELVALAKTDLANRGFGR